MSILIVLSEEKEVRDMKEPTTEQLSLLVTAVLEKWTAGDIHNLFTEYDLEKDYKMTTQQINDTLLKYISLINSTADYLEEIIQRNLKEQILKHSEVNINTGSSTDVKTAVAYISDGAAIEINESHVKVYMRTMIGYYAVDIDTNNQKVTVVPPIKGWKVIREEIPEPEI